MIRTPHYSLCSNGRRPMAARASIDESLTLTSTADRLRSSFGSPTLRVDADVDRPSPSPAPGQPVSYYPALRSAATPTRSYRAYVRAAAAARHPDLAAQNEGELLAASSRPSSVARRCELPSPTRIVSDNLLDRQVTAALEGVRPWRLSERREAGRTAQAAVERVADLDYADAKLDLATRQERLDRVWERLMANDREVVLPTVEDALEQRKLPAVPLDLQGDYLTLGLVLDSVESVVPERRPNSTPSGRRTLKKRTKTEVNQFYVAVLAALCVAAVRETTAVAPAVATVSTIACRASEGTALECVYVGEFDVASDVSGPSASTLFDRAALKLDIGGRTEELRALDLAGDPAVNRVVETLAAACRGRLG